MPISSLRVESDFAVTAHNNQIQLRFAVKHRPHSCQVKVYRVIDASAGRAGVGSGPKHLGTYAFSSRNRSRASTATGQVANGLVVTADNLGDVQEGLPQALGLNELDAAAGHSAIGVNAPEGLDERCSALTALESLGIGKDAHRTAPDGAISDGDGLRAVLVQVADVAALGACLWRHSVFGFNQVVIAINALRDDVPAFKVEDVSHGLVGRQFPTRICCVSLKVRVSR